MSNKEPYENVYIGNFIYSLGFLSAMFNEGADEAGVHLIQQTPEDKKWADLLTRWKGRYFILEFKREEIGCKQELRKKYCKKGLCKKECTEHQSSYFKDIRNPDNSKLKEIADSAHFIGFGEQGEKGRTISFFPYSQLKFVDKLDRNLVISMNDLCTSFIKGDKGASHNEFSQYLDFLAGCIKEDADGVSGFIVNIDGNGNVHLVDIEDRAGLANDFSKRDPIYPNPSQSKTLGFNK